MTSFGMTGTGFTPLPNTMDRKHNSWEVDLSGLTEPVNSFTHTVSAPTELNDNARFARTMVNARVAVSHIRNPMATSLPSWVFALFAENTAISLANYAHQEFPIKAMPWSPHAVEFHMNQKNWPAALACYMQATTQTTLILDDQYRKELIYSVEAAAEDNPHADKILQAACSILSSSDIRNDATSLSVEMRRVYELLQMLERDELTGPTQIKDDRNKQVGEDVETDGAADWTDLLMQSTPSIRHDDRWGDMDLEEPPRTERIINDLYSTKRRNKLTDAGAVIRRPDRMLSDGMVFNQRRTARDIVGAVLIDNSGSMHFHEDQVEELMLTAPGVIVAHYSGGGNGTLTIAAKDGKRVANEDLCARYGGNCVDGPALDWLGTQHGPRVWISDGYVTGANCGMSSNLLNDAIAKCTNYNITRVPTMDMLINWVRSVKKKEVR